MENSNFTILIVDDVPKNLQLLGNSLSRENYRVEFATRGQSALEWISQDDFDLVLLDIMMPEMDGFEVCQRIRQKKSAQELPIVFLTAKTDKESVVRGFELGGQDYLTKPFDTRELLERVRTQLIVKSYYKQQNVVNKWLEAEVKGRTTELSMANENLQKMNVELLGMEQSRLQFLDHINKGLAKALKALFAAQKASQCMDSAIDEGLSDMELQCKSLDRFLKMS